MMTCSGPTGALGLAAVNEKEYNDLDDSSSSICSSTESRVSVFFSLANRTVTPLLPGTTQCVRGPRPRSARLAAPAVAVTHTPHPLTHTHTPPGGPLALFLSPDTISRSPLAAAGGKSFTGFC